MKFPPSCASNWKESIPASSWRRSGPYCSFLPNNEVVSRGNADRDELIGCMGEEFTRSSYLQKAEEMGIKFETATSWLKRLCKNGLVEKTDDKGVYRKPQA